VEENYWGVARANRPELINGLTRGLRANRAAMAANALYWRNTSKGLALSTGMGLNLLASPDVEGSLVLRGVPPEMVWRAVGFTGHVVWRRCWSAPEGHVSPCHCNGHNLW
jgi:hypothetical protein